VLMRRHRARRQRVGVLPLRVRTGQLPSVQESSKVFLQAGRSRLDDGGTEINSL
jgi:hypothetical protein